MIRAAQASDATSVVRLIISAIGDELTHEYTGAVEPDSAAPILEQFFLQPGNRFSMDLIKVYEKDGEVAGMILCYDGQQVQERYAPIEQYMSDKLQMKVTHQIEAELDEYYIDALAVETRYQGQGIAGQLIMQAEQDAALARIRKVGLLVDVDNEHAKLLYARMGFKEDGYKLLRGHKYWHMVLSNT